MSSLSYTNKKRLVIATAFTFVFMAGYALSMGMLGTLLPRIIEYFGLSVSAASTINISNEIGNTSAMLFALFVVDRLDKNRFLGLMGLFFGASLLLSGISPVFALLLLVRVAIGFTGGLLDNICATYVSDLYGERRARFVSILHTLFAIGNMAGPQFASLCYSLGGWRLSFIVSGIVILIAAVLFILLMKLIGKPETAVSLDSRKTKDIPYGKIVKRKNLWWLSIASMMLAGETYLTVGLPTYLDRLDPGIFTTASCAAIMTAYSFGMLISRTGLAALSERLSAATYVRWASLLACIVFIVMLLSGTNYMVWITGMFLFGVISGASYTARFVLSCQEFPLFSSTASAFTGVFAALGNIMFNAVVGLMADAGFYTEAMYVIAAALLIAFIIFTFLYKAPAAEHGEA